MPTCLGIYVDKNLIKYAKVSKNADEIKIEASGIKFFENKEETLKQIVEETFSYKNSICVNLTDEKYGYFQLFSLLSKKDLEDAVKTEFDYFCTERSFNKNTLEYRYTFAPNVEDKNKITAMSIYTNKTEVVKKVQELEGCRLENVTSLPLANINLLSKTQDNTAIVNIESKTTITVLFKGEFYRVSTIDLGMEQILENINLKENSYAKAYEICKNTTIYTKEGQDLQVETNEYLEDIMPTLYQLVTKVKETLKDSGIEIDNVYISGAGAVINNIDLYFQDYMPGMRCEVLRPYFVDTKNLKVNAKDYIEANSAIALALQGLGEGIKDINFKKENKLKALTNLLTMDIGGGKGPKKEKTKKVMPEIKIDLGLTGKLDGFEKMLARFAITLVMLLILYSTLSLFVTNQMNSKKEEIQAVISDTNIQLSAISADIERVKTKNSKYSKLIENLRVQDERITEKLQTKNAIPTLLHELMSIVPINNNDVQITSIKNTTEKHIVITVQSEKYESLGIFIGKIKTDAILTNVTSNSSIKQENMVKVTIEGDLP